MLNALVKVNYISQINLLPLSSAMFDMDSLTESPDIFQFNY